MSRARRYLDGIKKVHRSVVWVAQVAIFLLSGVAAFLLRFDFVVPQAFVFHLLYALPIWVVCKSVVFRLAKLDRGWWRYVSVSDLMLISVGNLGGSVAACAAIWIIGPAGFPRSVFILDLMLCFLGTAGLRVIIRVLVEAAAEARDSGVGKNTLIYGAGEAGISLHREIQKNSKLPYKVVGFVDDLSYKHGERVQGLMVFGGGEKIPKLVQQHAVTMILIAIPSASGVEMTRILQRCHAAGVECKTVPGLGDVIEANGLVAQIRDVAVEDLLGRKPVRLEDRIIRQSLEGKMVLVTGAAGSIGSELCRQIARFAPAGIVGFEIAESPLFEIDREMKLSFPAVPFYPEIGSIQNRARLDDVIGKYSPAVIYHAAAYKHVPMMEEHVFEAVENNVFGTYNVAMAAVEHGVSEFVMISSDKAVRPTNVMGATKRVSELLLLEIGGHAGRHAKGLSVASLPSTLEGGGHSGRTKFVAVRFGNVLGSNGSVIPIFKKQIATGGPVTVTHPEMRRFFMTIPEACQLVLQAGEVGDCGQICVLDMGEPVRIVDLARNLILLSGLRPDEDIEIQFSGIRPGEKLYEELSGSDEETAPTSHEKIRIFVGNGKPDGDMQGWLGALREICEARDAGRLVVALKEIVVDYNPSAELLKRVIEVQPRRVAAEA